MTPGIALGLVLSSAASAALGYAVRRIETQRRERRLATRCAWCGGKRSKPKAPVCDGCLGVVKPLARQGSARDWPEDDVA